MRVDWILQEIHLNVDADNKWNDDEADGVGVW